MASTLPTRLFFLLKTFLPPGGKVFLCAIGSAIRLNIRDLRIFSGFKTKKKSKETTKMDNQLALMKKLQKDPDTIAYAHNEEIVLIKRVVDNDGTRLLEVTLNPETSSKISERIISDSEMKPTDFDTMKEFLTEKTRNDFNADWSATKLNVDIDKLENTDLLSTQSVEDDYIERLDAGVESYRTIENAMSILDAALNEKQKRCFLMAHREGLSDREIARREGVAHTTVSRGMAVIRKKIKKYLRNFSAKA